MLSRGCRLAPQLRNGPVKPTIPAKQKQRHERETCLPDCACNSRLQNCSTSHVQLTADGKVQQPVAQISNCSGISCKRSLLEGGTSCRGAPRQACQHAQHAMNRRLERHWGSTWEP